MTSLETKSNIYVIKRETFTVVGAIFYAVIVFFVSIYLNQFYTKGDQEFYTFFYENVKNYDLLEGYLFYNSALGASEPVYYLLVYYLSLFIGKTYFVAFLNSILAVFLFLFFKQRKMSLLFIYSLIINFYFLVLFYSAERLKLSLIFAFMYLYYNETSRKEGRDNLILILGFLSHLQFGFLLLAFKVSWFLEFVKGAVERFKLFSIFKLVIIGLFFLIAIFFLQNSILGKLEAYSGSKGFGDFFKPFLFYLLTMFYCNKRKLEITLVFIPLILGGVVLGSDRITILAYFMFLIQVSGNTKALNLGIILTSVYFIYKGIVFIDTFIRYGDGFYVDLLVK